MEYIHPVTGEIQERKAKRVMFATTGPSRTKSEFKDECDINNVMKRFEKTGILEHVNRYPFGYGDYTQTPQDYHSAINQVVEAENMFMSLPAKIRARFHNDPGAFLSFVDNPENGDELVKLGLATARREPPQAPTPEAVPAAPPAEPAP